MLPANVVAIAANITLRLEIIAFSRPRPLCTLTFKFFKRLCNGFGLPKPDQIPELFRILPSSNKEESPGRANILVLSRLNADTLAHVCKAMSYAHLRSRRSSERRAVRLCDKCTAHLLHSRVLKRQIGCKTGPAIDPRRKPQPPSPLARRLITDPIQLGIRSIDGLLTCARGQRVGIFGAPGTGKSTLLADIVRGTDADVVVVALVGERGREVREFVERQIGPQAQQRTIVVAATSDRPAMERVKAAHVATTIAEFFRDRGKHVLLLMDSLTRFARAQREIGLAAGEPATRRGFPPSLFAELPRLLERSGPAERGSITGIYTVLVEGDITLDPVAEEVQAILDGQVMLSNELAQRNHFPAIDVLRSRSRLMETVAPPEQRTDATHMRTLLARYADVELLVRVGEYQQGTDPIADEAIAKIERINAFLRQSSSERVSLIQTRQHMREIVQ